MRLVCFSPSFFCRCCQFLLLLFAAIQVMANDSYLIGHWALISEYPLGRIFFRKMRKCYLFKRCGHHDNRWTKWLNKNRIVKKTDLNSIQNSLPEHWALRCDRWTKKMYSRSLFSNGTYTILISFCSPYFSPCHLCAVWLISH